MNTEQMATPHQGRNIKRIREILGVKQEALATDLGISQQAISALEQKEALDREILEKVAKALKVSPDAIKNFSEEHAINYISNTFQDFHDHAVASANLCTFNPLDKLMEAIEENKKLYERLLQSEREKVVMMEKILEREG